MIGKKLHRDMAEVNVYTARRLREMACSLSGLARAFTEEAGSDKRLSFDEGLAAMQTAASMVCGGCSRCNLYETGKKEGSYYLYYLLRAFEQKGKVDKEDMPRLFHESCRRQEEYLSQLNRNCEARPTLKNMLSDLRESGAIEQDADIVMFLYREGYYDKDTPNPNLAECIIAKNRHGETRTVELQWLPEFTTFGNMEWQHDEY